MARTRTLTLLRTEVRQRADIESATTRFPDSELTRYINQGIAELYDLLVDARGRSYYRKSTPQSITTTVDTVTYALSSDFYKLIAVRNEDSFPLSNFGPVEEADLAFDSSTVDRPLFYDLQGAYIALRPYHRAGYTVIVDYVPCATQLSSDGDTFDGINGWEDYVVAFAARQCALKDEVYERADRLVAEMQRLERRISGLAPNRDGYKAERIQDARRTRYLR
jgi:hypothetical protein